MFQADVNTINNDVRHYDNQTFEPRFQKGWHPKDEDKPMNGWWNPDGSNSFRLVGCRIQGVMRADGAQLTRPEDDGLIGLYVANAREAPSAKLVDLDPQFQTASMIWGLSVRITDGHKPDVLVGQYQPSPFQGFSLRQLPTDNENGQPVGAFFQSVLTDLKWLRDTHLTSRVLKELEAAATDGMLSIMMHTFGYNKLPDTETFTLGTVVGAIGIASADEPRDFVRGRRFAPTQGSFDFDNPPGPMSYFTGAVDAARGLVSVDLGGAVPVNRAGNDVDLERLTGELHLAVLKKADEHREDWPVFVGPSDTVSGDDYISLGQIPYRREKTRDWLRTTAGIVTLPIGEEARALIADHPLAIIQLSDKGERTVLCRETVFGYDIRADGFQLRLNPGSQLEPQDSDSATVTLYASQWGVPLVGQKLHAWLFPPMTGQGDSGDPKEVDPPKAKTPVIGQPQEAVHILEPTVTTGEKGTATLTITAAPIHCPRAYLDGQVYFVGYRLEAMPEGLRAAQQHPLDCISLHVRDAYAIPARPTWEADVQPILLQYGNLYPIMSRRLVDLANYEDVKKHRDIIELAFSLDIHNPNYMPATRDLSPAKQQMLLNWLREKEEGQYVLARGAEPTQQPLAAPAPMAHSDAAAANSPQGRANSKLFRRMALIKSGATNK